MSLIGNLKVRLGLTGRKKFESEVNKAEKTTKKSFNSMRKVALGFTKGITSLPVLLGAMTLAGAAMGLMFKKAVDLYRDQETAERKLEGALRATGYAAGFTRIQLKMMASALQDLTKIGDEAIMPIQALLLTFKQLHGEIYERTIKAILDMTTIQGELMSNTLQLGKALNDPIQGLDGLSRVGVRFTEEQKETIKQMMRMGNIVGAQVVILNELEGQFKGLAEAMTSDAIGRGAQMMNAIGDALENIIGIGAEWGPIGALIQDITALAKIIDKFTETDAMIKLLSAIKELEEKTSKAPPKQGWFSKFIWGDKEFKLELEKEKLEELREVYKETDDYKQRAHLRWLRSLYKEQEIREGFEELTTQEAADMALRLRMKKRLNEEEKQLAEDVAAIEEEAAYKRRALWEEDYQQFYQLLGWPMEDFFVDIIGHANKIHGAWHTMLRQMERELYRFMVSAAVEAFLSMLIKMMGGGPFDWLLRLVGHSTPGTSGGEVGGVYRASMPSGPGGGMTMPPVNLSPNFIIQIDGEDIAYRVIAVEEFNRRRGL